MDRLPACDRDPQRVLSYPAYPGVSRLWRVPGRSHADCGAQSRHAVCGGGGGPLSVWIQLYCPSGVRETSADVGCLWSCNVCRMEFTLLLRLLSVLLHASETDLSEPLSGIRDDVYDESPLLPPVRIPDNGLLHQLYEHDAGCVA